MFWAIVVLVIAATVVLPILMHLNKNRENRAAGLIKLLELNGWILPANIATISTSETHYSDSTTYWIDVALIGGRTEKFSYGNPENRNSDLCRIMAAMPKKEESLIPNLDSMYGMGASFGQLGGGAQQARTASAITSTPFPNFGYEMNDNEFKLYKPKESIVGELRAYFTKNSGVIFTVALVILADHFVFGGAFRDKLKSIVDSFLNKATKQIEAD